MQHVKYFGGDAPRPTSGCVAFDDPESPCFRGRTEALLRVYKTCEANGVPNSAWDQLFAQHLVDDPYEGLAHVGGVAVVDEGRLRPWDHAISSDAYEALKGEILDANQRFRDRRIEELKQANDPARRAHDQDEILGWRTRVWIASYTELEHHQPYRVNEACRAYMRVRQYLPGGDTLQLVDLLHACKGDVAQAIYVGLEHAERFVDILAVAGFGPASLVGVVGTSPPKCQEGVAFEIATLQADVVASSVRLSPEAVAKVAVEDEVHLPLRNVRLGLTAQLPTTAFAHHWNALEQQAEMDAREHGRKRIARCTECGHEREIGWDTKSSFEGSFVDAHVDADFDHLRRLRGKIQHGVSVFETTSQSSFMPELSRVQGAALNSVATAIGMRPRTWLYVMTGLPVSVFECLCRGEGCTVSVKSMGLGVVMSTVPISRSGEQERKGRFGIQTPPQINPLVIPPMESAPP